MRKASWGQIWPQRGKIEILEKQLSPTAQNHYADLEDTCRDKVTKVGVIVRYNKKVIKKKRRLGSYLTPGGRLRVKPLLLFCILNTPCREQSWQYVWHFGDWCSLKTIQYGHHKMDNHLLILLPLLVSAYLHQEEVVCTGESSRSWVIVQIWYCLISYFCSHLAGDQTYT